MQVFRWAAARHQLRLLLRRLHNECTNACSIVDLLMPVGDGMCTHLTARPHVLHLAALKTVLASLSLLRNCNFKLHIVNTSAWFHCTRCNLLEQLYSLSRFRFINYDDISLLQPLTATLSVPQATTSLDVDTTQLFLLSSSSISLPSSSISVPRTAASTFQSLDARPDPHFSSRSKMSSVPSGCTASLVASKREREAER